MLHPLTCMPPLRTMKVGRDKAERIITVHDLPAPGCKWIPGTRQLFVRAVAHQLLSREEFCKRYQVDQAVFEQWRNDRELAAQSVICRRRRSTVRVHGQDLEMRYPLAEEPDSSTVLRIGDVVLTREPQSVTVRGERVPLGERTFKLMLLLMERHGARCTKFMLAGLLPIRGSEKSLDRYIFNLRKKIGADYIVTIYGLGWVFVNPAQQP